MAKNRNRRLRKKLYSDEFTVYGFSVFCDLSIEDEPEYDVFIDEFIDFIEARNLMIGGGVSHSKFDCFVVAEGRYGSVTHEDRAEIEMWFMNKPECKNIKLSSLVDVNSAI
ncbi:50S ribosome-binding protein YggL [Shewanella sp. GD03713]|uniref:YggL 50S ribosome-binding family protein n=1 Tax=Shewanella sp. GD03713 TaxID=2975372 RepID=UPI000B346EEA|nr:50S ribosome-binding protein YggL [Shewanella sp. GD03713]MDH1470562.1 YggL family protein [Shewanella sp. GD03713]QXN23323.1 YggL family protein [Shewanella putrefaciens]